MTTNQALLMACYKWIRSETFDYIAGSYPALESGLEFALEEDRIIKALFWEPIMPLM
jgi:hypothetical protein